MIKVEVNNGHVDIKYAEGTPFTLMAELCCIVKAVCSSWCEDEEYSEKMTSTMILKIADTLKLCEQMKWGDDLEDDENADS